MWTSARVLALSLLQQLPIFANLAAWLIRLSVYNS
jgi:hypothetical protein